MNRFSRSLAAGAIALAAAAASLAAGPVRGADRGTPGSGAGLGRTEQCLASIELSADQKTKVDTIRTSNKTALHADVEAWKASQKKLRDDMARGADKCVLGQDLIDQEAAAAKVHRSGEALRTRILAALTPEQQTRVNKCADSRRAGVRYPAPSGATR